MKGGLSSLLLVLLLLAVEATNSFSFERKIDENTDETPLPVVLMHGMGDAAGNSGMQRIRQSISERLGGVYVTNIQLGANVEDDIRNSYFLNMDKQLIEFAKKVATDPNLVGGFNAAGFSQGNLLIRAYIQRYNNPPVRSFISFHGPLAGVGALPQCSPTAFICKEVNHLIGTAVYSKQIQSRLAQSNYFRDPLKIPQYVSNALFLPDINNEKEVKNATYKVNFSSLKNLVLVRANADTMVFPKESEWFGAFEDGSYSKVLGFNETKWYKEDSFGLQTLHRAGNVHFFETQGNHLQFTDKFLFKVVDQFFH